MRFTSWTQSGRLACARTREDTYRVLVWSSVRWPDRCSVLCLALVASVGNVGCPPGPKIVPAVPDLCPTALGDQLLAAPTADLIMAALAEHTPTLEERQAAAAFWAYLIVAEQTGQLDPAFFELELDQRAVELAQQYPSLVQPCDQADPETVDSPLTAELVFDCDTRCEQPGMLDDPAARAQMKRDVIVKVIDYAGPETLRQVVGVYTWLGSGKENDEAFTDLLKQLPPAAADSILVPVGKTLVSWGGAAKVAILVSPQGAGAVAAVQVLAVVGSVVYYLVKGVATLRRWHAGRVFSRECRKWKEQSDCPPPPGAPDPDACWFRCQENQTSDAACRHVSARCNDSVDCPGGDDEDPAYCARLACEADGQVKCQSTADCHSGSRCNGVTECPLADDEGEGVCEEASSGGQARCGDGVCDSGAGEMGACPADCPEVCGDGICNVTAGETSSCPADCPQVQCCVDTNGCPSEELYRCPGSCCCCRSGARCVQPTGTWVCGI